MKMLELNAAVISQLKERDPSFPDVTAGVLVPQVRLYLSEDLPSSPHIVARATVSCLGS
jgi:hypothetical protein